MPTPRAARTSAPKVPSATKLTAPEVIAPIPLVVSPNVFQVVIFAAV